MGEIMGTDKLNQTARAAGFAMACDDVPLTQGRVAATQTNLVTVSPRSAGAGQTATAIVPRRAVKASFNWNLIGWNFWKTA